MTGGYFDVFRYRGDAEIDFDDPTDNNQLAKCDIQNGVGTDAQGGVFNCGGSYSDYFMIRCDPSCTPYLAISTLRIWTIKAVSSTGTFYVPDYNLAVEMTHTTADFDKVIKESSFWAGPDLSVGYALTITDYSDNVVNTAIAVELARPAQIYGVVIAGQNLNNLFGAITVEDSNAVPSVILSNLVDEINDISVDGISTLNWSIPIPGRFFTLSVTDTEPSLWLEKLVLSG